MSAFIEREIARFKDPSTEYGRRCRALLAEIYKQEDLVASYSQVVNPNPQDQRHGERYLDALKQTKLELDEEAVQRGLELHEDEKIYWDMYCAVMEERAWRDPEPVDLRSLYLEFREKYFKNSVPEVSDEFVVEFIKLPLDVSGASHLTEDAAKFGVRTGIRINEKLREFPAEAKVALLHEMIHATRIRKHGTDFKRALINLFKKGAYIEPLIL